MSALGERILRFTNRSTNHTTKALLASSVPKLETNLDPIHGNLLGDEKSTSGGSGVLRVKLVLSVSL